VPDLVESLRDIEENRRTISICFHIIQSFNNFLYLFYGCVFTSEIKLMIGINLHFSIIVESLGTRSFLNNFSRTGSKLIDLYDSANFADLSNFWIIIICAIFHCGGKKLRLRTALHS
jgi:hypothetical protein